MYFSQLGKLGARLIHGFSWEPSSRLRTADFSLCPHMVEREQRSTMRSLYKGTNPIHGGSILMS